MAGKFWLLDDQFGDYTSLYMASYVGNYSNPIWESLKTNQYHGMIEGFWSLLKWFNVGCEAK